MRVEMNERLAKRNRQIAIYLFVATLMVLVGSFLLVNLTFLTNERPTALLSLAQAATLPVALVLTLFSVRMTNLWARQPRPEDAIAEGLKGLSKKSVVYHYYHIPARHVLIAPQGVFAIVTRWHNGRFTVTESKMQIHQNPLSRMLSSLRMDGVGDPMQDARRAAQHVEKMLGNIAPDLEVRPLVIFLDPRAQITFEEESDVPVLYADPKSKPNLKDYMRSLSREQAQQGQKTDLPLTDAQIEAFEAQTLPN